MAFRRESLDRAFARYCATGDPAALGRVFDGTASELLRIAAWLAGNRADAEDLLQRTFLSAIEGRGRFDARQRALPWLCGILANHARSLQRERQRHRALGTAMPPAPDAAAVAAERELAVRLDDLRAELLPPYREVLELHLEQGLNGKEIAERLGRPAGTVRTQLVRGLELLRKRLPNGFLAGFAPLHGHAPVPAALKAAVLEAAGTAVPPASAAAAAVFTTGGMLVAKKIPLVAVAFALLVGATWLAWPTTPDGNGVQVAAEPLAVPGGTRPASAPEAGSAAPPPSERVTAGPADAAAEPGFASLRVAVRWAGDGRPAPGVGVGAAGRGAATNERRLGVTGADGACELRHMAPGSWLVTITHADGQQQVDLRAGEQGACEFTAARAATVRGRVVDDRKQAVPDAEVWVATDPSRSLQFVVARSGPDGAFAFPVADRLHIGARKDGFAPSLAHDVDAKSPPAEVVLALRGPGGRVQGTVRDVQGRPVGWARVLLGSSWSWADASLGPYAGPRIEPHGQELMTAADGTFAAVGVMPGKDVVRAWAAGFAVGWQGIAVTAGAVTACDVVLRPGASVAGQVRDAAGNGVADAAIDLPFGDWLVHGSRSDADGRYLLVDLPAGRLDLIAKTATQTASATLELDAGATTEWNPVLAEVRDLHGRVLGPDDEPLAGMPVGICDDAGMPQGPATETDASGRFELRMDGLVDLRVGKLPDAPLLVVRNVHAGADELVIRLGRNDLPSARISGRIVDERGSALAATVAASRPFESTPRTATTSPDGSFAIGPVPAGRWSIRVSTPAHGNLALDEFDLAADATHDLGDLVLRRPGSAVVTVLDERGAPTRGFVMLYTQDGQWIASTGTEQGRARFPALQPGLYFVCCGGAPLAASADLDVQPSAEARVDLQLRAVGQAMVRVRDPARVPDLSVRVFVFAAGGRFAGMFGGFRNATHCRLFLPLGSYRLECRASDGRRAGGELTLRAPEDRLEVAIDLPAR